MAINPQQVYRSGSIAIGDIPAAGLSPLFVLRNPEIP